MIFYFLLQAKSSSLLTDENFHRRLKFVTINQEKSISLKNQFLVVIQPAPSSIKQPKLVDKTWVKDVVLIPSPRFSSVPKFYVCEGLNEDKFVLSGFILHSLTTEKELRNTL